jgi:hypothetical protein
MIAGHIAQRTASCNTANISGAYPIATLRFVILSIRQHRWNAIQ